MSDEKRALILPWLPLSRAGAAAAARYVWPNRSSEAGPNSAPPHPSPSASNRAESWLRTTAVALGLVALTVLVYANALQNGFAFDDHAIVQHNTFIRNPANLKDLLLTRYWPMLVGPAALYRPTTIATYFVDWALWDARPLGFHLTNVLLHGLTAAALALLLIRLGATRLVATLAAVLFVVHPVHVEAVANVAGRAEILCAFFVLVALRLFLAESVPRVVRVFGIAILYLLALGAKEGGVMLPVLLVLVEWLRPDRRVPIWRAVWDDLPLYLALTVSLGVYLVLRGLVLGFATVVDIPPGVTELTTNLRTATAVRVWPEYLRLMFIPRDLAIDYAPGVLAPVTWASWRAWAGLATGIASLGVAVVLARRSRWWAAAWLWFAVTVFVVSNLAVPVGVWLAERTLYLPSVAVSFVVVAMAQTIRWRRAQLYAAGGVLVCIVLLAGRTWTRTPIWKSSTAALESLAREHPESFRSMRFEGNRALARGETARAVQLLEQAHALVPQDGGVTSDYVRTLAEAKRWAEIPGLARPICSTPLFQACLDYMRSLRALGRMAELDSVAPGIRRMLPPVRAAFATFDSLAPPSVQGGPVQGGLTP